MDSRSQQRTVSGSSSDYEKECGTLSPRSSTSRATPPPFRPHPEASSPPKTIVLGLWPGARSEQIEYYAGGYASLYPSTKVVLLHHSRTSPRHVENALTELTGDQEKLSIQSSQDTLIHLFGDDAASQICRLLRAYRARIEQPLGVKAIVLDSVPVVIAPNLSTLIASPQRLLIFIYLTIIAIIWRLASVLTLWFSEPLSSHVQRDLHDPQLLPADARKCYIFPERDIMFAWDRPSHAEEVCERQDFEVKRRRVDGRERWTGDQERYWLGIENAWEGR
ncbi:hypothetical protein M409DRAFT_16098 [Zasmidium cellare ATCC 36951]|uniref:Uncharacterized protein n=1 Tax=Zasmidium cellare ATCC 36951 TaxID=1080233 RepID=A0A6A6D5Y0_ZASCE|nr:uncharacterized protein M409DRAFT_16098 [Zasmidium cellare ATCC 36951]KAF2173828.1 hypothetical protein M409DRAFT_16098 [Zasmidium cellare ATCC 36951]